MLTPLLTDFYKVGHIFQYAKNTELVYSNYTCRGSRLPNVDRSVFFGLQYFMKKYLIEHFNEHFFNKSKEEVLSEYKRVIQNTIGGIPSYSHIEDLHDLGYLPIEIKALPEGTRVPLRTPVLTIKNTDPKFYWLTNSIETLLSAIIWMPINSATVADQYKQLFKKVLKDSIGTDDFVPFMGHDFSFRGMGGLEAATLSGMGHLTSFVGTDTIPAILELEKYYNSNIEEELVGCSVSATEHAVMSSGTAITSEFEVYKRLITEVYPSGIVSIVSDTFDLWNVLTDFMPRLKNEILNRDGKIVIRPDSGDPVKIISGWTDYELAQRTDGETDEFPNPTYSERYRDVISENEKKGVVELLWDVFGGTIVNGYKVLNDKVGAIYGDSITLQRAEEISKRLMDKGFAPLIVYGIGSFTYQYNTRDTLGQAMKATYTECNGKPYNIFKDPITDNGMKKSAKGLIRVNEDLTYIDEVSWDLENTGLLTTVFYNGKITKETSLKEIRERLNE